MVSGRETASKADWGRHYSLPLQVEQLAGEARLQVMGMATLYAPAEHLTFVFWEASLRLNCPAASLPSACIGVPSR